MKVKINLYSFYQTPQYKNLINTPEMDYYDWMQYLHDELEKEQIITYNNYNERYRNV
jgi:hypothetical protein